MRLSQRLALNYIRTKFKLLSRLSKRKAAKKAFELFCTPKERTDGPLPPIFDRSEKLSFPLEGATVHGYRWNHPSPKKLLILHGFESSVINFDQYVEPLIAKGYEVLAFDAPAHGRSTGQSINVLTYKNMVCRIMEVYGPVRSFLAHSFGGLSLSLALEEKPHDASTRVVLIAPATETRTAIENFFALLRLSPDVQSEFYRLIVETGGKGANWFSVARAAAHIGPG